jgi:hypothetical protein
MIPVVASAAVPGALIAGGSSYAGGETVRRNLIAGWWGTPAETRLATEACKMDQSQSAAPLAPYSSAFCNR